MNKLYYILLGAIIMFFAYGILTKKDTNPIKEEKRVPCQKYTVTFEKVTNNKMTNEAINYLQTGNFIISSRIEQSKYMKSKILNYITTQKADAILENILSKYKTKATNLDKKLLIDYYILENDREDKGKKGTNCKLYAGYLVFEFKLEDELIYKIQTDYMKDDTTDIPERIDCVIKSFISLKKE